MGAEVDVRSRGAIELADEADYDYGDCGVFAERWEGSAGVADGVAEVDGEVRGGFWGEGGYEGWSRCGA